MKVRFWGTRGSIAKAGPSTVRYGGNTSCTEVRSASGTIVVLDCGTGGHGLGEALLQESVAPCSGHILISHTHWDHIQGIPFFAPLFVPGNEWHIYGPRGLGQSLRQVLAGQMQYAYFPVSLDQFEATIHYHDIVEGSFTAGDIWVGARYLNHPALTMGYRLEANGVAVVYSTDHEPYSQELALGAAELLRGEDEAHRVFVQGADLLIHDAQYTAAEYQGKVGWGHSTVEYAADLAMAAQVRHVVLYHHDPTRTDDAVDVLVDTARRRIAEALGSARVSGAAEGEIIVLEAGPHAGIAKPRAGPSGLRNPADILANEAVLIAVPGGKDRAILTAAATADAIPTIVVDGALELLEALEGRWPSLIFVGDDLLRADPLELCASIRALPHPSAASTPLIVVTDECLVDLTTGEAAKVTAWLTRPFSIQYARSRIRGWLLRTMCRWSKAPLPADEAARIEALYRLNLLDTEAEERFDRHTRIAAAALEVPIALVSLVDRERQWFKSRHGLDTSETPRDMAFCAHAILSDDTFVVTDALQDERFADNPLVVDGPRARFYAGVPLRTADGVRIGTLCVIDKRPRDLRSDQLRLLEDLARMAEREFYQDGDAKSSA